MADQIESEWNINTDIYDIVKSIDNLKSNYIQDQDESTLALGIFGFTTDLEAKKIQSSIIMTGELGNEMFPSRANLTKNVLVHALYNNITNINAVPASIMLNIGIKLSDFEKYAINNKFTLDKTSSFSVTDPNTENNILFKIDYDIDIVKVNDNAFTATYNMKEMKEIPSGFKDMNPEPLINPVSNITNPYLLQPFLINIDNVPYVLIQTEARQYDITEIEDRLVSTSIIENKTFTFEFDNQLVDIDLIVTDYDLKTVTKVTVLPYGSRSDGIKDYCWYEFINSYTIRIIFDHKSYIPGLNCKLNIKVYTTLGTAGEFKILKNDGYSKHLYMDLSSKKYNYNKVVCYTVATTDSENASDSKTKEELQKLIPKAALSRGAITTETDLLNYFNLIDTETHRLFLKKKVDNQLSRIWYSYFLMKDIDNNIIPTNTINLYFSLNQTITSDDGRRIIPHGSIIKYDPEKDYGEIIDVSQVPDVNNDDEYFNDYYYYQNVYNIVINPDPLYAAFYLSIINQNSWLKYKWLNNDSPLQFVGLNYLFKKSLLIDPNIYKFQVTLTVSNSILNSEDINIYSEKEIIRTDENGNIIYDENGNEIIDIEVTNNMKVILVLYNEENYPYRWEELELIKVFNSNLSFTWQALLKTDYSLDDNNKIKLKDKAQDDNYYLRIYGSDDYNYGYFNNETKGSIYILAKLDEEYGRQIDNSDIPQIDSICGANYLDGYSLTNVYELSSGLKLYENFTNVLDTRLHKQINENSYIVTEVPVVGYHYFSYGEDYVENFIDSLTDKKEYIDYCLEIFENSIGIDYKFFNTYGPSKLYHIGDKDRTKIGHVDLEFKFRVSPKSNVDATIKDEIISYIKSYIEDLYNTGNLHIPELIRLLMNKYDQRVNYIEYMNFNDFWLGIQHIEQFTDDELENAFIVPEFLNIRNYHTTDDTLEPCIEVEIVSDYTD